jgi:protein gp37
VFTLSLGDFWDNQVPTEWRTEALDVIRACRNLDWLILTKRPQNIAKMLPAGWGTNGWPHVWLRATVENMVEARRRIPHLLRVPAPHHWLSCEPMLEPLDLTPWLGRGRVDWIVCGGESGTVARPMDADWARSLLAQCQAASVPFLMKQMSGRTRATLDAIPADLDVEQYPSEPEIGREVSGAFCWVLGIRSPLNAATLIAAASGPSPRCSSMAQQRTTPRAGIADPALPWTSGGARTDCGPSRQSGGPASTANSS